MGNYVGIGLRKDFVKEIDIKIEGLHYTSRADFIRYCIRRELERIEQGA